MVEVVAKKNKGQTLKEIKEQLKKGDGGVLSTVLDNLCKCDFIRKYASYGKKQQGCLYQLTDLFCLYHQKILVGMAGIDEHYWSNVKEGTRNAWAGYAFEQVCLHHISQIRHKLSIKGVLTNICSWSMPQKTDADGTLWPGAQIDLLLCRNDHVIDVCEMKYSPSLYTVMGDYTKRIRERNSTLVHFTKAKDAIHNILITTYGLKENLHSDIFHDTVTMDDLFAK